ncbi:MAG TPA: leucine-rich repeat domain-containing protein, partial [Phycisphaerae bacterium]
SNPSLLKNLWAKESGVNSVRRPSCKCLDPQYGEGQWSELKLHVDQQDTGCTAWSRLLELVDEAAKDNREEFSPGREMSPEQWTKITTLPASISRLKSVKHLLLYGSSLVRIPPEIGEMSSLEQFTPYTSYRLHWFPFEIMRCRMLRKSIVSTRAIYGNFKYRPPFPKLPRLHESYTPTKCSVCGFAFGDVVPMQYWISLRIATDVLPLLVHVCSEKCLLNIPASSERYVQGPHQGGLGLVQPDME